MNLPIATTPPQPAAQTAPANQSQANQAQDDQSQAAAPFGSVLARQLDSATAKDAASAASSGTAVISAARDKKDDKQAGDAANTPSADILAAMLNAPAAMVAAKPTETATTSDAAKGKALQLDSGKPALKLPADAINAANAKTAHKPATDSKTTDFTTVLNVADSKAHREPMLNLQNPTQAETQPPAATAVSQFMQNNPLAAAANTQTKLSVDTPVGSKDWSNDFGQKITWMASKGEQSAELHLNPPNLGPLDVVLKVSGDQATAMFTSPHAAVRDAVEQAMPKLREMMADNGIMLGNATVSDQAPRDNQAGQQPRGEQRVSSAAAGDTGSIAGLSQGTRVLPASRHNGLVDTFA